MKKDKQQPVRITNFNHCDLWERDECECRDLKEYHGSGRKNRKKTFLTF